MNACIKETRTPSSNRSTLSQRTRKSRWCCRVHVKDGSELLPADHDTVRGVERYLRKDFMAFIAHAHRDIADRIAGVENDGENLPLFHGLKLEFRLDEVVRADHPTQIQFGIRSYRLLLLAHVLSNSLHKNRIKESALPQRPILVADLNKKGQPVGCPFRSLLSGRLAYCRPLTRFGLATSVP